MVKIHTTEARNKWLYTPPPPQAPHSLFPPAESKCRPVAGVQRHSCSWRTNRSGIAMPVPVTPHTRWKHQNNDSIHSIISIRWTGKPKILSLVCFPRTESLVTIFDHLLFSVYRFPHPITSHLPNLHPNDLPVSIAIPMHHVQKERIFLLREHFTLPPSTATIKQISHTLNSESCPVMTWRKIVTTATFQRTPIVIDHTIPYTVVNDYS